jgi:hypothetical protein
VGGWGAGAEEGVGVLGSRLAIMVDLSVKWQAVFWNTVQQRENAAALREAAIAGRLGEWTQTLTGVVVSACESLGWQASAKWHFLELLPLPRSEYLALDVMAFPAGGAQRWQFPVAVFELENSRADDRIAYSLWKVLCVRTELRLVFCYRHSPKEGAPLVRFLQDQVLRAMPLADRVALGGETLVVVGSRDESDLFPYGFFRWWRLDVNIGAFEAV